MYSGQIPMVENAFSILMWWVETTPPFVCLLSLSLETTPFRVDAFDIAAQLHYGVSTEQ